MIIWEQYLEGVRAPTPDDFALIEARLGAALPADYKRTATAHAGRTPKPGAIAAGRGTLPFGVLLLPQADGENESYTIEAQRRLLVDWAGEAAAPLVPIADSTGHSLIAYDYRSGPDPRLVLVDLDFVADDPRAFVLLAGSFDELLSLLTD